MTGLFDPLIMGGQVLSNRVIMAPLTRNRALAGGVPGPLTVEYYRQRATAGLIIAEASQISPMGQGYLDTPGIYNEAQVAAWRAVTDAVHQQGGKIFIQLWHVGRISHCSLLPENAAPVSSTERAAHTQTFTAEGFVEVSKPRALRDDELPALVADYRHAARCAMEAGFDGVEIHAANAYLLEQFMRDSVNDRSGPYGGSMDNRLRLVMEVVQAVVGAIGAERTGIRLSPMTTFNATARDSDPQALFERLIGQLAPLGMAYVHMIEGETGGERTPEDAPSFDYQTLRQAFPGVWIANNAYTRATALEAIVSGNADAIAFGRPFISNPDLVKRLSQDLPLTLPDAATIYGGGAQGYTDYPFVA